MKIQNENDLKIFDNFDNVVAGFTRKPDDSLERREVMIASAKENGGHVVKPLLVHGVKVQTITSDLLGDKAYIEISDTDGIITDLPNVVLTTTHADCLPLYAYDSVKNVIGLAHSGWKGTAKGIAKELVVAMKETYGCNPKDINAYIGPGICKCHFEFGLDYAKECFKLDWMSDYIFEKSEDKVRIDLKGISKHFFEIAGVNNVEICSDCTYRDEDSYYSYRRANDTKRMLAYISLK